MEKGSCRHLHTLLGEHGADFFLAQVLRVLLDHGRNFNAVGGQLPLLEVLLDRRAIDTHRTRGLPGRYPPVQVPLRFLLPFREMAGPRDVLSEGMPVTRYCLRPGPELGQEAL